LLEARFHSLVRQWKDATGPSSRVNDMVLHPAYLQIVGMGPAALPLLLRELQRESDHWMPALFAITGEDAAKGQQTFAAAVDAWLDWGKSRGYLG